MKIYTKTGDKGKTSLFDGSRVRKDDIRVDTYGTLDELNSMLGLCRAFLSEEKFSDLRKQLQHIQNDLFDLGAMLANPHSDSGQEKKQQRYLQKRVKEMEGAIDSFATVVPEQLTFVLPGGVLPAAALHVARTICRRAERKLISLSDTVTILPEQIIYINRLSDFIFAASRVVNYKEGNKEVFWKKRIV